MIYLYWYRYGFLDSLQLYNEKKTQLCFVKRSLGFQGINL